VSIDMSVKLDESRVEAWNPDLSVMTQPSKQTSKMLKAIKLKQVVGLLIEFLGDSFVERPGLAVFALAACSKGIWKALTLKVKAEDLK